jgi:hypothetical protein
VKHVPKNVTPAAVSRLPAQQLAKLLNPALPTPWTPKDAAAALKHQLAAPLLPDLLTPPTADPDFLRPLLLALPKSTTFLKLLTMKSPPLDLLIALKTFSAHARTTPDSPLQGDPATLLYYAAIAAALAKHHHRITTLPEKDLQEGLTWSLAQHPPTALKSLYKNALAALHERPA